METARDTNRAAGGHGTANRHGKPEAERFETIVVGGGQAGLSVGYHLSRRGLPFVILDASERIGDAWRNRWDSLRLFTPARYDGLDGMPFPARPHSFPTKDEMADYLESYARRFQLPVRTGVRVDDLTRRDGGFELRAGERRFRAENVVVAMGNHQQARVPAFAAELDPAIVQLHSREYRNPGQLREGPVLLVGAGNSGSEIAMELAGRHAVRMSGRDVGQLPFRPRSQVGRIMGPIVLRFLFHRILTVDTPLGRKTRPNVLTHSGPLIRVKRRDLDRAGVEHVPRTVGVRDGLPVLEDGRLMEVANVIWCTGFEPGFSWIDLPIHGEHEPEHRSGIVPDTPGLYFVGLLFLHAMSSEMIHGVGRDAERVARIVEQRVRAGHRSGVAAGAGVRAPEAVAAAGG